MGDIHESTTQFLAEQLELRFGASCMDVAEEPSSVTWEPGGEALDWNWADGVLEATIPALHIHGALIVT